MSQDAKEAIAGGLRHAITERTRKIRPDHLLLAITDNNTSAGAQLLGQRGLRASDVHGLYAMERGGVSADR